MQTDHRAAVRRQHRVQRPVLHRRQIHQNTIGRQRRQAAYHLLGHVDRHADDHHAGIRQQLLRLRPIFLIQHPDLITRQRQQAIEQPAHLTVSADNDDRPQLRAQGFKALVVLADVRLAHHAAQHIFDQIRRHAEIFRLPAARGQHRGFALRHINRQTVAAFDFAHFRYQMQAFRQQIQQRFIHLIDLIAQRGQFCHHNLLFSRAGRQRSAEFLMHMAQQGFRTLPVDAGVGDGHTVTHVCTRLFGRLIALMQMALQHNAGD